DAGQEDKADGAEQYKANELSEPEEPSQGLAGGLGGNAVEGDGFLYEERIGADAAGGHDHAHAAHGQYAEGVLHAEVAGRVDGEEAEPGAQQVEAPDADGIDEEEGFVLYIFYAGETVPDVEDDVPDLPDGGDVDEAVERPATKEEQYGQDG